MDPVHRAVKNVMHNELNITSSHIRAIIADAATKAAMEYMASITEDTLQNMISSAVMNMRYSPNFQKVVATEVASSMARHLSSKIKVSIDA